MGDSTESFYNGGISSFEPSYGNFGGYRMSAAGISSTTSPQTAGQVSEVVARLKEGVKNVELQPIVADTFETIPKQHFEEIRALMKISGASPSLHAPLLDPAGFGERGGYEESSRDENERRFFNVIEKAHELDPHKNIPIVFHATGAGMGTEYRPGKEGEERFHLVKTGIVNQETGQVQVVKEDTTYSLNMTSDELKKGPELMTVQERIDSANRTDWDQKLVSVAHGVHEVGEILEKAIDFAGQEVTNKEMRNPYVEQAQLFMHQNKLSANSIFDKAYTYGSEQQRKLLTDISEKWHREMEGVIKDNELDPYRKLVEQNNKINNLVSQIGDVTRGVDPTKNYREENIIPERNDTTWGAPKINVAAEEFAANKSAETFGNLAFRSYEKFGSSAPIIAIENLYPGLGYSTADDLKKLIEKSRETFVKNAVNKKVMSEKEAKKEAEKLIGATWDVGHLNIAKKYGFNDEDLVKETAKIKDYVKHVHLTDNFGYADTHLAPGMGNVPIKEILKELEKTGRLGDMKKVIEAGGLTNPQMGLKMSPFKETLKNFGSSLYGPNTATYWNQVAAMAQSGGYFGGPLAYMPEKHFSMYGSGFSSLPTELGGQMPGNASRVSGTPMT